jgi:hypothetical protein
VESLLVTVSWTAVIRSIDGPTLTFLAVWYFFNDIYPSTHNGYRPMDPPGWWIRLFERQVELPDTDVHDAALQREVAAPAVADIR